MGAVGGGQGRAVLALLVSERIFEQPILFQLTRISAEKTAGIQTLLGVRGVEFRYKAVQILEITITQTTIQTAMEELIHSDDWGDPLSYSITVTGKARGWKQSTASCRHRLNRHPQILLKPPKEAHQPGSAFQRQSF
jgi:hypothetical protein